MTDQPEEEQEKENSVDIEDINHSVPVIPPPPIAKYLEPEKVAVVLIRNGGVVLEEGRPKPNESGSNAWKKDSIFQHKIPVHVRSGSGSGGHSHKRRSWFTSLFHGLFSSLVCSLILLVAKSLQDNHNFHPICTSFWAFLGLVVGSLPITLYTGFQNRTTFQVFEWPPKLGQLLNFIVGGMASCTGTILRFWSLHFLLLPDASSISFPIQTLPLTFKTPTSLISKPVGVLTTAVVVIGLGIGTISRPPFLSITRNLDNWEVGGVCLGLGSLLLSFLHIHSLQRREKVEESSHWPLLLGWGLWGLCLSGFLGLGLGVIKSGVGLGQWMLISLLASLSFLGGWGEALHVRHFNVGVWVGVRGVEVGFGFLWQFQFLRNVVPDLYSGIGAVLVVGGVVGLKWWMAREFAAQNPRRGLLYLSTPTL